MSHASELKDLLPRRKGVIFTIGLLGGFLAAIALSLFVMIARAAEHQDVLRPMNVAAPTQAVDGETLAGTHGCLACHSIDGSSTLGPSWLGVFGTERLLASGESVTVDAAYIERSIVDPRAQIADGFPEAAMPTSYGATLSADEISALVGFISDLEQAR